MNALDCTLQDPSGGPARATAPEGQLRVMRWRALGTTCAVQYMCGNSGTADAFAMAARDWVEAFEAKYSRFRPDSLISRINAEAGRSWTEVDDEMDGFLDLCGGLYSLTRGVLDVTALPLMRLWDYRAAAPRIPTDAEVEQARRLVGWPRVERRPGAVRLPDRGMAVDFGGWGKEYAVDVVAGIAAAHGIAQVLVDFGHDLRASGTAPGKPAWHVGIEDPMNPDSSCWGSLAVLDRGIASSGDYRRGFTRDGIRYGHIIDPRTGRPVANGTLQTTVVGPTCLQAGVLATAAFVLSPDEGTRLIEESMSCEGCIITPHARHQTRRFFTYVVPQ